MSATVFAGDVGTPTGGGSYIEWRLAVSDYDHIGLTVAAPNGDIVRREFAADTRVIVTLKDLPSVEEGIYNCELTVVPRVPDSVKEQLKAAREKNDERAQREILKAAGIRELKQSDSFTVLNGSIVAPGEVEKDEHQMSASSTPSSSSGSPRLRPGRPVVNDQVIPDDLIVQGSTCVGLDCVNGEVFDFDTVRLKENNTRIQFFDTSAAGFASNNWQIRANQSGAGGANFLAFVDQNANDTSEAGDVVFAVEAGATTNSVWVDNTGRVGFRTTTPVLDLHVNTSNTPAIRLEQNNSGGFTAQTWDMAGNEANFFIRDATNNRLTFRIRPGAPTSSLDISADGDIGMGTAAPDTPLHILRSTGAIKEMLLVENNNEARISIENNGTANKYIMGVNNTNPGLYFISKDGGGGTIVEVSQRLDAGGVASLKVNGSVQATNVVFASSRELKNEIAPVDGKEMLARLASLPISEWTLKSDELATRHIGPMAEDFHAAFGVGKDGKTISVTDANGIALSAIQGLAQALQERDKELAELKARMAELEKQIKPQQ